MNIGCPLDATEPFRANIIYRFAALSLLLMMNRTNCSMCFMGCVGGVCYSYTVKKAYCRKCNKKFDAARRNQEVEQVCPDCGGKAPVRRKAYLAGVEISISIGGS